MGHVPLSLKKTDPELNAVITLKGMAQIVCQLEVSFYSGASTLDMISNFRLQRGKESHWT